jgi:hypothetical protein
MSLDIMVPLQKRLNLLLLYTFIGLDSPFLFKKIGFLTTRSPKKNIGRSSLWWAWHGFQAQSLGVFGRFSFVFFEWTGILSHNYGIRIEHLCEKQSSYDQMWMAIVLDCCFTYGKSHFFSHFLLGKTWWWTNELVAHMGMSQNLIPMGQNWTTYLDVSSSKLIGVAKFDPYPCW